MKLPAFLIIASFLLLGALARAQETIKIPLADGFDLPVGKPDGEGYYVFRGYWPNAHQGEDWNGKGGGNTDLGDPVYSIGAGVVVLSRDVKVGWGNVVIVRHAYRDDGGKLNYIDSLYGHLDKRTVWKDQIVKRGQELGTIGTAHGKYLAHLHFEIRKNLRIGMNRSKFARDYSNYFSPRDFVKKHRKLRKERNLHPTPINTFDEYQPPGGKKKDYKHITVPTKENFKPQEKKAKGTLDPELAKIIENNRKRLKIQNTSSKEMDSLFKRLFKKLRRGSPVMPESN